jgi:hypothetical protein
MLSFATPGSLASAGERPQLMADHQIWLPPVAELLGALEAVAVP